MNKAQVSPTVSRPIPTGSIVVVVCVALLCAISVSTFLMWQSAGIAAPEKRVAAQADALRSGAAAGAFFGALLTLYLAIRRQQVQERVAYVNEQDAREMRLIETYGRATEQLASESSTARMAALYLFERIGQNQADLRQQIVDVLCGYLRRPFPIIAEKADDPVEWKSERDVRNTAQGVLKRHLSSVQLTPKSRFQLIPGLTKIPNDSEDLDSFWHDIHVDLSGATLENFNFNQCAVKSADFSKAVFAGIADFQGFKVSGPCSFQQAQIADGLEMGKSSFHAAADFRMCEFLSSCDFSDSTFYGEADFAKAAFVESHALSEFLFGGVHFAGHASFADIKVDPELISFADALFSAGVNLDDSLIDLTNERLDEDGRVVRE